MPNPALAWALEPLERVAGPPRSVVRVQADVVVRPELAALWDRRHVRGIRLRGPLRRRGAGATLLLALGQASCGR